MACVYDARPLTREDTHLKFLYQFPVRFADIDHAGIVYYPKIFHYYHVASEEFLESCTELSLTQWMNDRRFGFPTVHVEGDFRAPLFYGDRPQIFVTIPRVGTSSVDFAFRMQNGDVTSAEAVITKTCVHMDKLETVPIPDDLRKIFERYGAES